MVIVDLVGPPANWATRKVELVGVPDLYPEDPEPEFIDINRHNIAAVTMQENNHIALIDLKDGKVIKDFSAGSVDLDKIDTAENELIELNGASAKILREPTPWHGFPTADSRSDEGDLDGGSRGLRSSTSEAV